MVRSSAAKRSQPLPLETQGDLEPLIGYNLKRAYVVVSTDFRRAMGEKSLAPRQFSALSLIVQFPNITQSELAGKLGIERSGLVAIIDDLEKRGFVLRQAVRGDRRLQALEVTEQGSSTYEAALTLVKEHEDALLSDFSEDEIATLVGLLQRIRSKG